MRWCALITLCTMLVITCAEPDPKKYKSETKDNKQSNGTLTADEKKFLREVEEKFGIKSESEPEVTKNKTEVKPPTPQSEQAPFPAVIAIEIVNDTDTKSKGKRTIDANLGYGYKTNAGYTYSYFGKPAEEKGKFTIYPYSQEDIPATTQDIAAAGQDNSQNARHYAFPGKNGKTSVEIQPSQAFELVPVKDEKTAYHYRKPSVEFKTPSPSYSSSVHPSTLYTTYNGEQFTGLSGQFPSVMSNYLVDPTQLLKNPEFQNVGLTQDHLRQHGSHLEQKVVPVLVLRIPSSSLTNPTAELYANLPQNYPLSNYLNNVNLQELVNQYFKKSGYSFAPQVTFTNSLGAASAEGSVSSSVSQYEPQHYAHPYVQPSYTQADLSGVQYSAVQPVMAKYPSSYVRHHYTMPKGHSLYKQPTTHQKYEYQYVPQSHLTSQKLYYHPKYQQQTEQVTSQEVQNDHSSLSLQTSGVYDTSAQVQYEEPAQVSSGHAAGLTTNVQYDISHSQTPADYGASQTTTNYGASQTAADYGASQIAADYAASQTASDYGASQSAASYGTSQTAAHYGSSQTATPEYEQQKEDYSQSLSAGYDSSKVTPSAYESSKPSDGTQEYYTQLTQKESLALLQSQFIQPRQKYQSHSNVDTSQTYVYQQQGQADSNSGLVLSENYPSNDHTIATVLPSQYKASNQNTGAIQSVSYVTPMPSSKYRLPYNVMVPQTFLHNPTTEKVAYINSHSVPSSYSQTVIHHEYNPEAEYTVGYNYVPPISKQKPPSYPRNYHSHPKRMAKPEKKQESSASTLSKKQTERNEKRTSS